jgi:mRNA interferase RelE/StbE
MQIVFTEPFRKDYQTLPFDVRKALDKALEFLIMNPRHPSLRAKKLPGTSIWYARITRAYRFTFYYQGTLIILRRAGTHHILKKDKVR